MPTGQGGIVFLPLAAETFGGWQSQGPSEEAGSVAAGGAAPEGERGHDGHDPHLPCCPD